MLNRGHYATAPGCERCGLEETRSPELMTVYGRRFEQTANVSTSLFEDCRRESQSSLSENLVPLKPVSRIPPFRRYRLPRMVHHLRPMRHVPEVAAILRLVRTRLRSRHP
jgi:hypothetical protein